MKYIFTVFLTIICGGSIYGQKINTLYHNGCIGNVESKTILMFNGKEYSYNSIYGMNVEEVLSLETEKGEEKDKIIVNTKEGYIPDIESLYKIIEDRIQSKEIDYIAVIDGRIMVGDYKDIAIDKKSILGIEEDNIDINTVKRKIVLIRTKSSLYKKKYIR